MWHTIQWNEQKTKVLPNTLGQWQNGRHLANDIFKCIFLNGNLWIPIEISLKFVPRGPIDNIPALVQLMPWQYPRVKPLSEPMMVSLPTHICITRPQWVNKIVLRLTQPVFSMCIFLYFESYLFVVCLNSVWDVIKIILIELNWIELNRKLVIKDHPVAPFTNMV